MPIRSIIVHLELEGPARPRVEYALDLCERFGAHLIGFAAGNVLPMVSTVDGIAVEAAVYQEQVSDIENRIKAVRKEFRQVSPDTKSSFAGHVGDPAGLLSRYSRAADLIVTGNPPPGVFATTLNAGDLILNAGRPVLLAPDDHGRLKAGTIVIAWKDAREARRAVVDAMPFLATAKEVVVTTLGEGSKEDRDSLADVAKFLERHGIAGVRTQTVDAGSRLFGEAILKIAADNGADLVVAGGYGHSRLRELIFGGVTRELLHDGGIARLFSN